MKGKTTSFNDARSPVSLYDNGSLSSAGEVQEKADESSLIRTVKVIRKAGIQSRGKPSRRSNTKGAGVEALGSLGHRAHVLAKRERIKPIIEWIAISYASQDMPGGTTFESAPYRNSAVIVEGGRTHFSVFLKAQVPSRLTSSRRVFLKRAGDSELEPTSSVVQHRHQVKGSLPA